MNHTVGVTQNKLPRFLAVKVRQCGATNLDWDFQNMQETGMTESPSRIWTEGTVYNQVRAGDVCLNHTVWFPCSDVELVGPSVLFEATEVDETPGKTEEKRSG